MFLWCRGIMSCGWGGGEGVGGCLCEGMRNRLTTYIKRQANGDCVRSCCQLARRVGVRAALGVNEAARFACVCVFVYMFVHTSHLHGAMPHRLYWGV